VVVDIGAGYCEFINNINARIKYAVDLNRDAVNYADKDVKVFICNASNLNFLSDGSVDIIFMSNFLEHCESKNEVSAVLNESYRVCRGGGRILILQPNIKYAYREYWDFFDHNIPLSHKSLVEALELSGFRIKLTYPRFLPYTTKGSLPTADFLIKAYLKIPLAWKVMGSQAFVVAEK
jgi:ubiquinone/menaquinone biosynthesis C-methylase UbiE